MANRRRRVRCSTEAGKWIKYYSSYHRILLVGEGDFSFALSLATAFGFASNIVATSLDLMISESKTIPGTRIREVMVRDVMNPSPWERAAPLSLGSAVDLRCLPLAHSLGLVQPNVMETLLRSALSHNLSPSRDLLNHDEKYCGELD